MYNNAIVYSNDDDDDAANALIDSYNTPGIILDPEVGSNNKTDDNDGGIRLQSPTFLQHQQTAFAITMLQPPFVSITSTHHHPTMIYNLNDDIIRLSHDLLGVGHFRYHGIACNLVRLLLVMAISPSWSGRERTGDNGMNRLVLLLLKVAISPA